MLNPCKPSRAKLFDVAGADVDEERPGEWQTIPEGFLRGPNGEEPHEEG